MALLAHERQRRPDIELRHQRERTRRAGTSPYGRLKARRGQQERERIHSRTVNPRPRRRILPQSIRLIPAEYTLDESTSDVPPADHHPRRRRPAATAPYRRRRPRTKENDVKRTTPSSASLPLAAFATTAVFPFLVVVLHFVQLGHYHPLRQAVSELALGRAGWLMAIAFCAIGIGSLLDRARAPAYRDKPACRSHIARDQRAPQLRLSVRARRRLRPDTRPTARFTSSSASPPSSHHRHDVQPRAALPPRPGLALARYTNPRLGDRRSRELLPRPDQRHRLLRRRPADHPHHLHQLAAHHLALRAPHSSLTTDEPGARNGRLNSPPTSTTVSRRNPASPPTDDRDQGARSSGPVKYSSTKKTNLIGRRTRAEVHRGDQSEPSSSSGNTRDCRLTLSVTEVVVARGRRDSL